MYIRRKVFSKTDSSTEKKNNKAEVVTAGIGLGATLGKTVKDYKDLDIDVLSYRKGARKRELAQANEILKDVNTIRNNGFYVNKFRGSEDNHWFNRKTGTGQLEAANNAMLFHDKADNRGLHKIARKQLKSAEKHAKRAVEMLNEDISHNNRLLKSAYKKLGRNTAIGLAGTGLSVLGVNKLKNRNKK